ncbi:hypothetical protein VTN96DRAFT_5958 [Rasamsonia emersonii]
MQAAADVTGVCAAGPLHAWRSPTPERRIPLACHSFFCNGILLTLPALSSLLPAKCASWTHAAPSSVLRWRDCCLTRHLSLLLTSQAGRFYVSATASLDKKGSLAPQFLSCLALVASAFKVWGWGTSWKLRSAISGLQPNSSNKLRGAGAAIVLAAS